MVRSPHAFAPIHLLSARVSRLRGREERGGHVAELRAQRAGSLGQPGDLRGLVLPRRQRHVLRARRHGPPVRLLAALHLQSAPEVGEPYLLSEA